MSGGRPAGRDRHVDSAETLGAVFAPVMKPSTITLPADPKLGDMVYVQNYSDGAVQVDPIGLTILAKGSGFLIKAVPVEIEPVGQLVGSPPVREVQWRVASGWEPRPPEEIDVTGAEAGTGAAG